MRRSVAVVVVVFSFFLALGGVGWRRSRELVRATGGGGGAGASGCNHCLANIFVQNVLIQFLSCMRAPSAGKHNSTRVDERRKSLNLLAIKMQGTNRSGWGGRRACYVTPDLSYD